jgi:hypothetical protein
MGLGWIEVHCDLEGKDLYGEGCEGMKGVGWFPWE